MGRRNDPNYSQVTGLIKKEVATKLRIYCAATGATISDVIEEAVLMYLDAKEKEKPSRNSE